MCVLRRFQPCLCFRVLLGGPPVAVFGKGVWPLYMTVQGMMQQLQSSPHQHDCLIGTLGPFEEEVEVVDGGIMAVVGRFL